MTSLMNAMVLKNFMPSYRYLLNLKKEIKSLAIGKLHQNNILTSFLLNRLKYVGLNRLSFVELM